MYIWKTDKLFDLYSIHYYLLFNMFFISIMLFYIQLFTLYYIIKSKFIVFLNFWKIQQQDSKFSYFKLSFFA